MNGDKGDLNKTVALDWNPEDEQPPETVQLPPVGAPPAASPPPATGPDFAATLAFDADADWGAKPAEPAKPAPLAARSPSPAVGVPAFKPPSGPAYSKGAVDPANDPLLAKFRDAAPPRPAAPARRAPSSGLGLWVALAVLFLIAAGCVGYLLILLR